MRILKVVLTQYAENVEHQPNLEFSYLIFEEGIKISEEQKCEVFSNIINLLYLFYPNKTFKRSKPIRIDFLLDNSPIGSYCQRRFKMGLNKKYLKKHKFLIQKTDYILLPYDESYLKQKTIKKKESFVKKDSYMQLHQLCNSKEYQMQKLPKKWQAEITVPMYS